nr:MAG TPA: hypothetical protein [Caudoviricetes sp.]
MGSPRPSACKLLCSSSASPFKAQAENGGARMDFLATYEIIIKNVLDI